MTQRIAATAQDYYELLVRSAWDGTFPSFSEDFGDCAYRKDDRHRCGVGVLIPDELYVWHFEKMPAESLPNFLVAQILPDDISKDDLYAVQRVHDRLGKPLSGDWKPSEFVRQINFLKCFAGCRLQDPEVNPLAVVVETAEEEKALVAVAAG